MCSMPLKIKQIYCALFLTLLIASCAPNSGQGTDVIRLNIVSDSICANNSQQSFSVSLYENINKECKGNLVFSPLGIEVLYSMLREGTEGKTRDELDSVLGISNEVARNIAHDLNGGKNKDDGTTLNMANLVVVNACKSVNKEYKDNVEKGYVAEIWSEDLASPSTSDLISKWICDKTNGMINNNVGDIDPQEVMCAINTLYFHGTWCNQFNEEYTEPAVFTNLSGKKVKVDMMRQQCSFNYFETNDFQTIALPYVEREKQGAEMKKMSFYVFLPQRGKGFEPIKQYLRNTSMSDISEKIQTSNYDKVQVCLPRFEINSELNVASALRSLGVKGCSGKASADFSHISKEQLYVGDSRQNSIIQVCEKATEAASATKKAIGFANVVGFKEAYFYADHPFIYMIVCEDTHDILFMGQYTEGKIREGDAWITDEDIDDAKVLEVQSKSVSSHDTGECTDTVYDKVEQMPSFPGGNSALMTYLSKNIRYPSAAAKNNIHGRVVCNFIIEKDGSVSDVRVINSVGPSLDKEAVRLLSSMPKWNPGKQKGKAVRVKYTLPVNFQTL